jgi:Fe2+ or Zn2+ uptake regulation protein
MKIERLTNQKKAILDHLRSTSYHPDAYEVYEKVKKKLPQISLATVYRNLDSMAKKGLIKEIRIKEDRFNYDGVEHHHHHFRCSRCGSVFNIEGDILLDFEKTNESGVVGLVEEYDVMLKGVCMNCKRKEKQ